jgi:hypothetical protein
LPRCGAKSLNVYRGLQQTASGIGLFRSSNMAFGAPTYRDLYDSLATLPLLELKKRWVFRHLGRELP